MLAFSVFGLDPVAVRHCRPFRCAGWLSCPALRLDQPVGLDARSAGRQAFAGHGLSVSDPGSGAALVADAGGSVA